MLGYISEIFAVMCASKVKVYTVMMCMSTEVSTKLRVLNYCQLIGYKMRFWGRNGDTCVFFYNDTRKTGTWGVRERGCGQVKVSMA